MQEGRNDELHLPNACRLDDGPSRELGRVALLLVVIFTADGLSTRIQCSTAEARVHVAGRDDEELEVWTRLGTERVEQSLKADKKLVKNIRKET